MEAIVLDIDGTLLESYDDDTRLYLAAIREVLGPVTVRNEWGDYQHVTDGGILEQILVDNDIVASESVLRKMQKSFSKNLSKRIETQGPFVEIPGAKRFVESLLKAKHVKVAYATGGWHVTAKLKLQSAGFPISEIPLATSDDSNERVEIMQIALKQLGSQFDKVTYYGDGEWDRTAAKNLAWNFEPVGKRLNGITEYSEYAA